MRVKEYVPSVLKPLAHEIKFRLFNDEIEGKLQEEVEDMQLQWLQIINNSSKFINDIERQEKEKHVLFVTGYGVGTHFLTIEPIIAMALYTRGCRISSLYCNKSLPSCEYSTVGNNKPQAMIDFRRGVSDDAICYRCNKCQNNIETTYGILPIELHGYDRYLEEEDYELAEELSKEIDFEKFRVFVFKDIKVGEEAFASVLRATFMGEVHDTKVNRYLVQRYIMSGILTAIAFEKAYRDIGPDRIVCIHGIYQTHGLAVKVANKLNIPVVVLGGGGIRKDTIVVTHDETYHRQLVNEDNSVWQQFKLTEQEKQKTFEYAMLKRNNGTHADYFSYHPNPIEDVASLYQECNIDSSREIVSLYTNVIWDAQILYEGNAFENIFDWIVTSINELGKNKNIWVVIRVHPAEAKGGNPTKQPMLAEIFKRFDKLPENVRIIPPESDLSSYTLAQESVANIIYGTKMGLEIALMKRPLIVCGETFSRNKGYGLDITSRQQYIDLAKDIHNYKVDLDEKFEIALQYAHYFYFRKMVDMPFETNITSTTGSSKKLKIGSFKDISQGNSKSLDMICDGVMNLKPFYMGAK